MNSAREQSSKSMKEMCTKHKSHVDFNAMEMTLRGALPSFQHQKFGRVRGSEQK
jgi:hypothetical protein